MNLQDKVVVQNAECHIQHLRAGTCIYSETVTNVKTNTGTVFFHTQIYGTSPGANGLNYIGLSADSLTETSASTTLSNEITGNGFARVQGVVTLPTGSGTQTTIAKTFTATGTQTVAKAALFSAASSGTMSHVIAFTNPRDMFNGDQLILTYTLTCS